ncbi:hypothetical protein [Occallatibacter savannae]|uniref:hypothetical protein n=1 Tax=Occallatibacter savannae TaxID=1002691 RepID=UPI000D69DA83|nr:hypothetical protein [Occallatibacter savannae]
MIDHVIVRFRPSKDVRNLPSESLNNALVSLSEADELQPLLSEATAEGKALAIEVFQNREGRPVFINFKKEELEW